MESINPTNGQLIKEYKAYTEAQVSKIIGLTYSSYKEWRLVPGAEKSALMKNAAAELRKNKKELARLITMEMGKIIRESEAEIEKCAWVCDYYADNAGRFLQDEFIASDAGKSFVSFEPLGIILAVMPWNFPFWQVFRFAAPALIAGNAGLLKHASNVSGCALAIESIFKSAGFPDHLFSSLLIPSKMVEPVIAHRYVRAVTLTGSEGAGSAVASAAGKYLKKSVLELGGSDPYIVLDDADLNSCVKVSAQARMLNAGQSCIAAKRFIVVRNRLKEFERMQTDIISKMKIGDPLSESTDIGPLARPEFVAEIDWQIKQSVKMGARLLCGGSKIDGDGSFYQATVLSDVRAGMPVYREETFGPVSVIIPVKNEEEAIAVANDSEFGLGGSLWTRDIKHGEEIARRIESGSVFINGMTKSDPRLPFGGIKKSGYGRELSHYGLKEFVNIKTIWIK
ncbi:MAG: NAD-dependent succinate-semialdehyde dehydrogenase [Calditrichaceae bacterium]|nr:NAD-dependent succinate-semialdehyde dehydrogenase [Calditrichaceae bacterium]MBN2709412.1 NAD-dependent succinate-semialdehyde dehydrogenase [Calditrichaceae bacterium]RQV93537.1 MAG: NAD-dependent succinate-semialdehyde dehydrogenase [Calditrichota bacterium]